MNALGQGHDLNEGEHISTSFGALVDGNSVRGRTGVNITLGTNAGDVDNVITTTGTATAVSGGVDMGGNICNGGSCLSSGPCPRSAAIVSSRVRESHRLGTGASAPTEGFNWTERYTSAGLRTQLLPIRIAQA